MIRHVTVLAIVSLAACTSGSSTGSQGNRAPPYYVYVTNEASGDVSIVDPVKRIEIDRIAIGKRPRGLAVSPDGTLLYVAVSGSPVARPGVDEATLPPPNKAADGIAVIDLARRQVVRRLRGVSDPEQIAISPDGERLYVASEDGGSVVVLGRGGDLIAKVAVGGEPEGVAVSPDGRTALATSEEDGTLAIIRGASPAVTARIKVGMRPRTVAFLDPGHVAVPGETDASISLVDLGLAKVTRRIALPKTDRPMGLMALNDHTLLITTGRGKRLVRIDTTGIITGAVDVGERPWGLALAPDRRLAFTANGPTNDVTFVDPVTMKIVAKVKVGNRSWGVAAR